MFTTLGELLADPAWVRLDRQESQLMAGLAAELTDENSSGCGGRDFGGELDAVRTGMADLAQARHD